MVHEVWGQKDHPSGLDRNTAKFGRLSTLQATTPQPGSLFIPKQGRRTSFMIPNHPRVWKLLKYIWWRLIFLVPLLLADAFSVREMGQNGVSGQVLLRFAPFLLQWYFLLKCRRFIYKWHKSGQLVVRYDRLVVKSGVHVRLNYGLCKL